MMIVGFCLLDCLSDYLSCFQTFLDFTSKAFPISTHTDLPGDSNGSHGPALLLPHKALPVRRWRDVCIRGRSPNAIDIRLSAARNPREHWLAGLHIVTQPLMPLCPNTGVVRVVANLVLCGHWTYTTGEISDKEGSQRRQTNRNDTRVQLDIGPDGERDQRPEDIFVIDEQDQGDADRGSDATKSADGE